MGAARFRIEVFRGGGTHPWYVRVIAPNGRKLNASEGYSRRSSAVRAAKRLPAQVAAANITVID